MTKQVLSFDIWPAQIAAIEIFAADQDVRHYLKGTAVWQAPDGAVILTATDGCVLGQLRIAPVDGRAVEATLADTRRVILPAGLAKGMKSKTALAVVVTVDDAGAYHWTVTNGPEVRSGACIDGTYPDVARVQPASVSGQAGMYNMGYLARIQKAADTLYGNRRGHGTLAALYQNGASGPAVWVAGEDLWGVIMPMRWDTVDLPEWAPCRSVGALEDEAVAA
jgi:hypothetical protein